MDFAPTAEQRQLRAAVATFLADRSNEAEVRRQMVTERGYDPEVWARLAGELGLVGLIIPVEYGGSGASWLELGIALEEMGRSLLCAPFLATAALAVTALLESGDETAKAELLPGIAAGSIVATVALGEEAALWEESAVTLIATATSGAYRLDGCKNFVLDGLTADVIITAARTADGPTLFLVSGDAEGLRRTPLKTLDLTRKLARLDFSQTTAVQLGRAGEGWTTLRRVLEYASIGLAAEQVGGAQAALESAVDYAKNRVQFGQAIGAFQAIKHKCADVLVEVESARSAMYYGLWTAAEHTEESSAVASLVRSVCSDAYVLAAHENIQIHGGIGYTWAMPAHLYYKRAKSSELYLGDPVFHRERLARCIGL